MSWPFLQTDFHQSNVHCSCFLAQASLFFQLVSFSSGFFASIRPWKAWYWTVDIEMCLLPEFCEAFIWVAIWGATYPLNELILCSRGNSGSSIPVAVLVRASFIIAFHGYCECTWRNFQVLEMCLIDLCLNFLVTGGSIFTSRWNACPNSTACYSSPEDKICILLVDLDRKHSEDPKLFESCLSITELI